MNEIPIGWEEVLLEDLLVSLESGARPKGGVRGIGDGIPSVGGEHLTYRGIFDFASVKYVPEEFAARMAKGHIHQADILVVKDGATTGKTAFVDNKFPFEKAVVNEHVFICRPSKLLEARFLFRYLTSQEGQQRVLENFKGSAQGGINQSFASNTIIPVAPFNEQRRIVAKLETLLGKVDACQQRLAKFPRLLKRFRQAVLAAACSGRLTADWRQNNHTHDQYEIETVEAIAEYVGGFAYKSPTFIEAGDNQVLRIGNVRPFELNLDASPVFIPDDIAAQSQRFELQPNDIVLSMTGTKYKRDYGYAGIVRRMDRRLFLNQRVARLRCGPKVLPLFLLYWLQTDTFRDVFFDGETGNVNQGNVGADGIRKAPIELPSLVEQQEIVRRVESFFRLADQLEARYHKAKAYVDKLTQSLLAKAFRGELVPQDPQDEPATVLLERIRAERAAQSKPTAKPSKRAAKRHK